MEATFRIQVLSSPIFLSRTKLEPYDPKTRTTTLPTTTPPDTDLEVLSKTPEFDRRLKAVEEEFIQSGPTHLLEAVYCDPCKAKVMDLCQIYVHA